MTGSITDIPGVRVGHWSDLEAGTGCTVVLFDTPAVAGVEVRGAAPATRETELLRPGALVGQAHAILLAGGSAFGLDAASGVMRFLEERGVGFPTNAGRVPIVPAAALFDLSLGRSDVRPGAESGYVACQAAGLEVAEGTVGAGTGATVAKLGGPANCVKGGIGTAVQRLPDGTLIAAIVAVNAVGSVFEPATGTPLAEPRGAAAAGWQPLRGTNTTIGVVATNARLDAGGITRLAMYGQNGLALAIRPAHTIFDGDAIFAVSLASERDAPADPLALATATPMVVAHAIARAIRAATPLHGVAAAGLG